MCLFLIYFRVKVRVRFRLKVEHCISRALYVLVEHDLLVLVYERNADSYLVFMHYGFSALWGLGFSPCHILYNITAYADNQVRPL